MPAAKVFTYVAVFAAGALALAGFTAFSNGSQPPSSSESPVASVEQVDGQVATPPGELADATPIGDITRNSLVTVTGTVQAINDEDEFTLVDDSGSIRVWTAGTFFTVDPGEQVTVEGVVDDDLVVEISAQQIIRSDGSVIAIDRSSDY